mmetsp:Transcript_38275/g.57308  ORF Transcript_38275/g.57308 Transcript_38275/m.57308 type:complete len:224 (-) Transcript_38275:544-1215(-)
MVGVGDSAPDFNLPDTLGKKHKLSDFKGKRVLLSFNRYAACPVCLYTLDRMREQADYLRERGIFIICIFASKANSIARWVESQEKSPFLLLSDKEMVTYKRFKSRYSWKKANAAGIWVHKAKKELKGRGIPFSIKQVPLTKPKPVYVVPSDFLIDENGKIADAYHSVKFQDMMSWERIEAFIPKNMRCKCNGKDCLSTECRVNYKEIMAEAENMFAYDDEDDE